MVGEVVEVSAAGVLFGNIRWISGERITDVGVLVVVVAVVLPHAGDRDAVKSGGIIADLIESILQVINTGVVPKFQLPFKSWKRSEVSRCSTKASLRRDAGM